MATDKDKADKPQEGTGEKPKIFISYSHRDKEWMKQLVTHLRVLEKQGLLFVWEDTRIDGGDKWYPEIKAALNKASISILLISADFLTSDFILKEEVPHLLELGEHNGMLIIPILVRPCFWKAVPWLKEIQILPGEGKSVAVDFKDNWDVPFEQLSELVYRKINEPSFRQITMALAKWPALPEDHKSIERLPFTGSELFGRQKEMKLLDEVWDSGETKVIYFVAWGGVGKSTLINKWLESMKTDNYRGAKRVFGWSFYSQGTGEKVTSSDFFIKEALIFFDDPNPEEGSPWGKGQRLAELIRREKTLLILDGLEPLQAEHDFEKGMIKDPALSVLVSELGRENHGFLIITTREDIPELNDVGTAAIRQNLEQISPGAGRALLRTAGVRGTDKELEDASRSFGNHALALRLLGSYLYEEDGHLISHAEKIPGLEDVPIEKGRHPRRVMAAFEARFGDGPEVEFLRILGLFDRPAEEGAIEALLRGKTISHLTKQIRKLGRAGQKDLIAKLRNLNLIAKASRHDGRKTDSHPLVREHFGKQLETTYPEAWREGNNRLYDYFKTQAPELPNTIEEMSPLLAAVAHGCAAGRHQEALDEVFWTRIRRGDEAFSVKKLGAFGADHTCLSHFFETPWHTPIVGLTTGAKAFVLHEAGFNLRALGRLNEAAEPLQAGMEIQIAREDWKSAARDAESLSELFLTMGQVGRAAEYAVKSVGYADKSEDAFAKIWALTTHADALYQAGSIDAAERLFREAEEIQRKNQPEYPWLYSLQGFQYCNLLLEKENYQGVIERAGQTLKWAHRNKAPLLEIALDHLSLGRDYLLKASKHSSNDYSEAEEHLNDAVEELRKGSAQEFISRGLLARAEFYRIKGDFSKAKHDLDEAMTIATRGGMKLYAANCHLEYARLYLAEGDKEKAKEHLLIAKKMIDEMGYHRRDKEVKELEGHLR